MVIVSKQNRLVKEFAALKEKKFRKETGHFLIEGEKMVRELRESGLNVVRLACREGYEGDTYSLPVTVFGADAFAFICDEKTPQGVAAEAEIPVYKTEPPKGNALVLDRISDPANLGAIIRTANAAGYGEIYLIDCADPYSPKSVRASMSGVFYVKIMQDTRENVLNALNGVPFIAADMNGENVFTFSPPQKFALCIGNEGNGLSQEVRVRAAYTVKIPMGAHTESLNAAVSAGIFMYLLSQKKFY